MLWHLWPPNFGPTGMNPAGVMDDWTPMEMALHVFGVCNHRKFETIELISLCRPPVQLRYIYPINKCDMWMLPFTFDKHQ